MTGVTKVSMKEWMDEEHLKQLTNWAREGLTNEQIASVIGINECTIYRWMKKESKICNAIKEGRALVIDNIETSMYKMALQGWTTRKIVLDKDGDEHEVWEEQPPSATLQMFIMKTRKADKYGQSNENEVSAKEQEQNNAQQQVMLEAVEKHRVEGFD